MERHAIVFQLKYAKVICDVFDNEVSATNQHATILFAWLSPIDVCS